MNLKYLLIKLLITTALSVKYQKEFETYSCQSGKSAFSLNLNSHALKFPGSFSIGVWFKYKNSSVKPLISINTLVSNLVVGLNYRNKLVVNEEESPLPTVPPSGTLTDFQVRNSSDGWNYLTFFFRTPRTQSKSISYSMSLNYQDQPDNQINFDVDLKKFYLTLGSD